MIRTGIAELPLHYGSCPRWLFERMKALSKAIAIVLIDEYGVDELLRRISDPFWFQALGCVVGFDWHSSGLTTTLCGALKEALKEAQTDVMIAGGKGKAAKATPDEIAKFGNSLNISTQKIEELVYSSKLAAKVDSAVLQDLHEIYHHAFIFTSKAKWAVVQQGMDVVSKTARRYHWLSEHVKNFVEEPHEAILSQLKHKYVLDMTSRASKEARACSVDLAKEKPQKLQKQLEQIVKPYQKRLNEWIKPLSKRSRERKAELKILRMPKRINWNTMRELYEFQPQNYEELVAFKGVGPAVIRALALISDLVYGAEPSWKDPVKYSFAVGGKDGVPFPVDREVMDKSIDLLKKGIEEAKVGKKEKLDALKRLRAFVGLRTNLC